MGTPSGQGEIWICGILCFQAANVDHTANTILGPPTRQTSAVQLQCPHLRKKWQWHPNLSNQGLAENGTTHSAYSWAVGISTLVWPVILIQIPETATINGYIVIGTPTDSRDLQYSHLGASPTNGATSPLLRMKPHQVSTTTQETVLIAI